jgi:3-dehydroquinate dehydratase
MLVRLENLSKSSTLAQISESIAKQVQEKKQKLESIQKKEGLATIEKIKEEENQMRKIEKFKQNYQGNKDS